MKKIITSILLIMCCFMFTACMNEPKRVTPVEDDTTRFQYIGQDSITQNGEGWAGDVIQYYVDNETSIIYIVIINRAGNGTWAGFTPMIDTDGTYVTYDEFKNAED
jgi:starvation-inducible outer membrane lipoprotein